MPTVHPPPPRNTTSEEAQLPEGMDTAPELFTQESYADACRRAREEKEDLERHFQEAMAYEQREIDRMVTARNRKHVPPLRREAMTNRLRSKNHLLLRPVTQKRT